MKKRIRILSITFALMMCLAAVGILPIKAKAAVDDEAAYAQAFEKMRQRIKNESLIIGADSYPSSNIADCSYAFYDIDKNGVNELIFKSEGGTAVIYTLHQGKPVSVAEWGGYRDYFDGINELGYMYGGGSSGAMSGGTRYYRVATDGSGGELVAEINYEYDSGGKVAYTVKTPKGTKTMSESEAEAFRKTISAPNVTLSGWKTLTASSGASSSTASAAGSFSFYRGILDNNKSGITGYSWFLDQSSSPASTAGRVALADICGDGMPELLFITRNGGDVSSGYTAGLRIYGCDSQQQLLLSRDAIDVNYSSGARYGVFTTKDKGIYIYRSEVGYEWGQYELTRYVFDGQKLAQESTLKYDRQEYDNRNSHIYEKDGKQIQQSVYDAAMKEVLKQLDTVLLQSSLWSEPYWKDIPRVSEATMSLTEAASYLSSQVLAQPTASAVLVNGKSVAFDAYNINDNNYFKLRDLAYTLSGTEKQFDVGWDGANNAISLTSGQAYTPVGGEMTGKGAGSKAPTPTSSKITLNGKEVSFTAYNIGGNNYFKLRDIGQTFNFGVTWDGARNTIVIDTGKAYTAD